MGKPRNYYITDGSRFIWKDNRGKYSPTNGEMMADKFTLEEAQYIFNNKLPKWMKGIFRVEKIKSADPKQIKALSKADIQENVESVLESEYAVKWLAKLKSLNGLADEAAARQDELREELSVVDKQIQDELHYIEFVKCNAYQGFVSFKRLQVLRRKRRRIKNELTILGTILNRNLGQVTSNELQEIIAKMDNRNYCPRSQAELFKI